VRTGKSLLLLGGEIISPRVFIGGAGEGRRRDCRSAIIQREGHSINMVSFIGGSAALKRKRAHEFTFSTLTGKKKQSAKSITAMISKISLTI